MYPHEEHRISRPLLWRFRVVCLIWRYLPLSPLCGAGCDNQASIAMVRIGLPGHWDGPYALPTPKKSSLLFKPNVGLKDWLDHGSGRTMGVLCSDFSIFPISQAASQPGLTMSRLCTGVGLPGRSICNPETFISHSGDNTAARDSP